MVTSVFARDSALKLDLPQGSRADQVKQPPVEITVSVDKASKIYVNGEPTSLKGLNAKIQAERAKSRTSVLVLRGDKNVVYGTIMPVLDEVSRSGVQLTLALEAPATK